MGDIRQHYEEEFKRKTIEHWEQSGKTLKQISQEMGIPKSNLTSWKKQYGTLPKNSKKDTQVFVDYERLKKLEQLNKELAEENEILKKAMHFFTKNRS